VDPIPNYSKCFVCGEENPNGLNLRFHVEGDGVVLRCRPDDKTMGFRGIVHGGILATLLDETMGWAATMVKKRYCMAAEVSVRFVQSLPVDTHITVSGRLTRDRSRVWETEGEVSDAEGTVYARARGKYMPMSLEDCRAVDEYLSYPPGGKSILEAHNGPD